MLVEKMTWNPRFADRSWERSHAGAPRAPVVVAAALALVATVWTLPQTVAGLAFAVWRRIQGHRIHVYQYGPALMLVVRAPGPASAGLSLGAVVFADRPQILQHEFSHLLTATWLSWLYLPVYGLEYLLLGHDGSWHERLTCRFERTVRWPWQWLGSF